MKKTRTIIQLLLLFIVNILLLLIYDVYDSQKYSIEDNYNNGMTIDISEMNLNKEQLDLFDKIASNNNILIYKDNYIKINDKNIQEYFLSKKSANTFLSFVDHNKKSSTFKYKDYYEVKDFMSDNYYTYDFLNIKDFNSPLKIVSKNTTNFESFFLEIQDNFPNNIEGLKKINSFESTNDFYIFITTSSLIISFIIILFIIIINIFYFTSMSKTIGVYKLLGYRNSKIFYDLNKNQFKIYLVSSILIFILFILLIPNINISFIISFITLNLTLIILLLLSLYCSFKLLMLKSKTTLLIKEMSFNNLLFHLSQTLKYLATFCVVAVLIFSLIISDGYLKNQKQYTRFQEIDSYSLIYNFYPDTNYLSMDYTKLEEFNNNLYEYLDNRYDIMYINFIESRPNEDINIYIADKYFLDYLNINTKNLSSNQKTLLVPENIKQETQLLIENDFKDYEVMYYKNNGPYKLFQFNLESDFIKDPIFIYYSPKNNEIGNFFGESLNTGLKINSMNKDVFNELETFINENNIKNLFKQDSVKTQLEIKEELNNMLNYSIYFLGILLVILGSLYIILSINHSMMYISKNNKEIFVKKLLGYRFREINNKFLLSNLIYTLFICTIGFIFYYLLGYKQLILCFILLMTITIIDQLIVSRLLIKHSNNSIAKMLKEGD